MSRYTSFLGEVTSSNESSFEEQLARKLSERSCFSESCYAPPPLTPSGPTTPSSSVGSASVFTPPQVLVDSPVSALQALLLAMQQPSSLPFSRTPSPQIAQPDYTAAAASLLHCLTTTNNRSAPPPTHSSKTGGSLDWLTAPSSQLQRQPSSESTTTSSNPAVQALLNSTAQLTSASVVGKVMELATDRNGSRLLQKLLTQGGPDIVARVMDEVEYSLPVIMCDTYANYMCQQLFQAASAAQRVRLLSRLSPRFVEVARDRRGTHSLQSLISHISTTEEEDLLADTIQGQVEAIALDVHATHVLQQAISCCLSKPGPVKRLDFVFEEVCGGMHRLAVDPNALGVVKRCITHSQARRFATRMAERIESHMSDFVENPYANYAVQHALETWSATSSDPHTAKLSERLVMRLSDRIAPMALHKFASNVAEMAIKSSAPLVRHALIEALHYDDDCRMLSLMRSPFGVFVVGTAIKHAEDVSQSHALTMAICRNLKKLPDGRNKSKWEKLLAECAYSHQFFSALAASVSPSTAAETASFTSSSRS